MALNYQIIGLISEGQNLKPAELYLGGMASFHLYNPTSAEIGCIQVNLLLSP